MGSAIIGLALSLRNYWDTWAERTLTRKKRQQCLKARSRDGWHCWRNAPKVNERFIPANSQILLNGVSSALKRYSLSAIETLKKPEISWKNKDLTQMSISRNDLPWQRRFGCCLSRSPMSAKRWHRRIGSKLTWRIQMLRKSGNIMNWFARRWCPRLKLC